MDTRGRSLLALALVALAVTVVLLSRVERAEPPLASGAAERTGEASSSALAAPPAPAVAPGDLAALAGQRGAPRVERSAPADEASAPPGSFYGLVTDGQSGAPLAGAHAQVRHDPLLFEESELAATVLVRGEARSAPDGVFRLDYDDPEWFGSGILRRDGYGARTFVVEPGHSSRDRAMPIELLPCASLEVRVRDGEGHPVAMLDVDLELPAEAIVRSDRVFSARGARWRSTTDDGGCARFACLPAHVRFELTVSPDPSPRASVALAPGEHDVLEFVSDYAEVRGVVLDTERAPLADVSLVLLRVGLGAPLHGAHVPRAHTDGEGRFLYRAVAWGQWELRTARDGLAQSCLPLVVDRAEIEVELCVPRGLSLAGRVVAEQASEDEMRRLDCFARPFSLDGPTLETEVEADGSFRFAALVEGEYEVFASERLGGGTEIVRARAGDEDVRLPMPARIPLRVRTDVEEEAQLLVHDRTRGTTSRVFARGGIELFLSPGRYALTLRSLDERIAAVAELELSGSAAQAIALETRPAAVVRLVHGFGARRLVRLHSHGAWFEECELVPDEARTFLVPPGPFAVELLDQGRVLAREALELAPRERLRLDLGPR